MMTCAHQHIHLIHILYISSIKNLTTSLNQLIYRVTDLKELGGRFSGALVLVAPNKDLVASLGVLGLFVTTACSPVLLFRDSFASVIIRELVVSPFGR